MDYPGPRSLGPVVPFTGLFQDAIERPIDRHASIARMLEHPQKPIFHGAPIEVFDNMQNFQDGRLRSAGQKDSMTVAEDLRMADNGSTIGRAHAFTASTYKLSP